MRKRIKFYSLPICIISFFIAVVFPNMANAQSKDNLKKVSFALHWEIQSQFAGYLVAKEKGFYEDEGLDVTIIPGGANVDPIKLLNKKRVDFCLSTLLGGLETYRSGNGKMVLLSQLYNRSNFVVVAWNDGKDGNNSIFDVSDLDGKTISVWDGFRTPYEVFFNTNNIKLNIVPQYYTFSLFLHRGVDACAAMLYNELHGIMQSGVDQSEISVFKFHEHGVNFPEDGVYCLNETLKKDPETCDAFVKASLKGWEYAKDNREETLDLVMKYIDERKLPINRAHMRWMLRVVLDSIFPRENGKWEVGKLSKEDFNKSVEVLDLGKNAPKYNDFVAEGARNGLD